VRGALLTGEVKVALNEKVQLEAYIGSIGAIPMNLLVFEGELHVQNYDSHLRGDCPRPFLVASPSSFCRRSAINDHIKNFEARHFDSPARPRGFNFTLPRAGVAPERCGFKDN
jgi:hypothetical protein